MSGSGRRETKAAREAALHEDLIETLYAGIGNDGWQSFIDCLSTSYGGALTTLALRDYAMERTRSTVVSDWDDAHMKSYEQYYSGRDDWAARTAHIPVGGVTVSDELVTPTDLARGEFYQDWCRPKAIDLCLSSLIQREGSRVMGVAVLLPRPYLAHDPLAVSRLRRLAPHLLRAAQLERQFQDMELRALSAEAALGDMGVATLLCEANGRPVMQNAAAEVLLAAADGITLTRGRLDALIPAEGAALRSLISQAASSRTGRSGAAGGTLRLSRRDGRVAHEVLVSPAPRFRDDPFAARAVVFARDPAAQTPPAIDALRQLYRLSPAEARLLQTLLTGASLNEAAAQHGLSRETLRSQLRGLFRKLDVSSQRELMRFGTGSLAALRSRQKP